MQLSRLIMIVNVNGYSFCSSMFRFICQYGILFTFSIGIVYSSALNMAVVVAFGLLSFSLLSCIWLCYFKFLAPVLFGWFISCLVLLACLWLDHLINLQKQSPRAIQQKACCLIFKKFTGKHLSRGLFFNKLAEWWAATF